MDDVRNSEISAETETKDEPWREKKKGGGGGGGRRKKKERMTERMPTSLCLYAHVQRMEGSFAELGKNDEDGLSRIG